MQIHKNTYTDRHTKIQKDTEITHRHADTNKHIHRQTHRDSHRHTEKNTDMQIHTDIHRHTEIQKATHR